MKKLFGAVEIGGTKQQLAVIDETGRILDLVCGKFSLPNGAIDVLNWIEANFPVLLGKYEVCAIGVGYGGILESSTGRVLLSVQVPGWQNFMLRNWFEEKFGIRTVVVNDTVCGGYAEYMLGSGRGYRSFYYTNIGTGIGGAMFFDGKTYDGVGYGGVYMGNTYVGNPLDVPGSVCKLENFCSGMAIEKRLRRPGRVPADSVLMEYCGGNVSGLSCYDLKKAADAGDAFALAELELFASVYGVTLANFITLFSPQRVAIGGGVANMGEVLMDPIRRHTAKYVFESAQGRYDVVQCELMDENVLIGAALYARDGFNPI
ncbi:MAG: ROK family protein [Clostridiales bacterium]|nr:ROK family protein [Clostridiales bacterium]MBE5775470.1 ROK family protein [Clostridiales bacterium]